MRVGTETTFDKEKFRNVNIEKIKNWREKRSLKTDFETHDDLLSMDFEIVDRVESENILGKVGPGIWVCECSVCGQRFMVRQFNYKQVGTICHDCKVSGGRCNICGSKIPIRRKYCVDCLKIHQSQQAKEQNKNDNFGFKRGEKNIAKDPKIKEKLSRSIRKSYNSNPKLRELRAEQVKKKFFKGKVYDDGLGNKLMSKIELSVAKKLQEEGISYEYENPINLESLKTGKTGLHMLDFSIEPNITIEVCGFMRFGGMNRYFDTVRALLVDTDLNVVVVTYPNWLPKFRKLRKLRHLDLISLWDPSLREIELEGISDLDYTHALPEHRGKCRQLHSHSSLISVWIRGTKDPETNFIVDFGDTKKIIKDSVNVINHKVLIGEKYTTREDGNIKIQYETDRGEHEINLPEEEVYTLEEATIENISFLIAEEILERMPENVYEVKARVSEGKQTYGISLVQRGLPPVASERLIDIVKFHIKYPDLDWRG